MLKADALLELLLHCGPAGFLRDTATRILVQRDVVLIYQIFAPALDVPRAILAEVFAALGDVIPNAHHHIEAHPVPVGVIFTAFDLLEDARIEVFSVVFELQVEGHMVDTRADEV